MESQARIFYRHSHRLGPGPLTLRGLSCPELKLSAQSAATMRDVQRYADRAAAIPRKPLHNLLIKLKTLDTFPRSTLASTGPVPRGRRTVASTPWRTPAHTAQCPGRNTRASGHCHQPMYRGWDKHKGDVMLN